MCRTAICSGQIYTLRGHGSPPALHALGKQLPARYRLAKGPIFPPFPQGLGLLSEKHRSQPPQHWSLANPGVPRASLWDQGHRLSPVSPETTKGKPGLVTSEPWPNRAEGSWSFGNLGQVFVETSVSPAPHWQCDAAYRTQRSTFLSGRLRAGGAFEQIGRWEPWEQHSVLGVEQCFSGWRG